MGALVSRWKAKPTTVERLEGIDKDIKDLEEFRAKNQRLLKVMVGRLLLYSSVLYLLTCLGVYCCYLPDQWAGRLLLALPFLAFPVLVWFMRRLLIFLFTKRTERNNDKLEDLKVEKRKTLEEVMETETYKNAKVILERFDPEARNKTEMESTPTRQVTPGPGQEVRQRGVALRPPLMMTPPPGARPPQGPGAPTSGPLPHAAPGGPPERGLASGTPQSLMRRPPLAATSCTPVPGMGMHPPGPPLSRPILPRDRGAVDRVIEYLVGDGPQNRYALICQQCCSHNGMALREEFDYIAFRCAYCYFLNPARRTRPQAPRLPEFSFERRLRSESPEPSSATASADEKELDGLSDEVELQAAENQSADLQDGDPQDGDLQDGDLQDGDLQIGDPQDGDLQDGDLQDGDPQDGDPQDGDPQDGDLQDGDPQDGDPQDGDPQDGDPQDGDPQDGDLQDRDPQDGDPQSAEIQDAGESVQAEETPESAAAHSAPQRPEEQQDLPVLETLADPRPAPQTCPPDLPPRPAPL